MKKFFKLNWPLVAIFLLSFLITWPLFIKGYFSHHDDLQVMRIFEMRKCLVDLQIPCRWVPDMGYGYGYPLFNFYAPLAYYLGAIFSFVIGYIGAAKLIFFLPLVLGGAGMYFLARELFGEIPGFVAGVLYLFAPYRALDAYVRGAVGESMALSLLPLVFYFFLKLSKGGNRKLFLISTITMFLFLVSHNIMTLIFTPLIILWIVIVNWQNKWKGLKVSLLGLIISFFLASFFLLPAFFEKGLVQTDYLTQGELNFRAQFVKVSQLFWDISWRYGASSPQKEDTISYQIGWPQWWVVAAALVVFLMNLKDKKRNLFIFLILTFSFGVLMTHNKSAPIWERINILTFVQFPWRFLSYAIFSSSLLGAYFVSKLNKKWLGVASVFIVVLTIPFNWRYFRPQYFYKDVTDQSKLSGDSFVEQQKGALLDYLPKTAIEPKELPEQSKGFEKTSNSWELQINSEKGEDVVVPVFYFPGWVINYPYSVNKSGTITVSVPEGQNLVIGKFTNTPVRTLGNSLTLLGVVGLVYIYAKNRKNYI